MIDLILFFSWINKTILTIPATVLFFGVAVFLTLKTRFVQLRAFPHFIKLLIQYLPKTDQVTAKNKISSIQALFTAMGTTIGTGNVVGPSIAIISGGPGALFWLLIYIFFGCVTKFAEVSFALHTRVQLPDGKIIGGPMEYLKLVNKKLALWYTSLIIFLFISWSTVQSNTLAHIFAQEGVPHWIIGLILALLIILIISGGAHRVGAVASKLVPLMSILYIVFALLILFKNPIAIKSALLLIAEHIFSPAAPIGAFMGASIFYAMRHGIYRGILITEAGVGTSSIPHAIADTNKPIDQAILAMGSTVADATLSALSGLLILTTGIWKTGAWRTTLIYEVFAEQSSCIGRVILLFAISLFVITTVIGNSFNGIQSFSSLTKDRWVSLYVIVTAIIVFFSSFMSMLLIWEIMDTLVTFVVIPNLIGLIILSYKKPNFLNY